MPSARSPLALFPRVPAPAPARSPSAIRHLTALVDTIVAIGTVAGWLALLAGCEPSQPVEAECPEEGTILSYQNFGEPLLLTWCVPCHSSHLPENERQDAPVGVDFDDYDGVLSFVSEIHDKAADDTWSMPPAGGLEDAERAMLSEWLACGAPR